MTESALRMLIWDVCCNHPELRDKKVKEIGDIQDLAVKLAKSSELLDKEN